METARVRLLCESLLVGTRVCARGDVVEIPTGERLDILFETGSAEYADPHMRTPTPDEVRATRESMAAKLRGSYS